jgi:hypothetical protein
MKLCSHYAGRLAIGAAAFFITASLALAQNYNETGDAGSTVPGAQNTGASNPLNTITGSLFSNGDADFYVINITNFATFSATTVGGSTMDTMLYLFDINGNPIYLNDDASNGLSLQSTLPPGSPLGPQANGLYIVGISLSAVDPVNGSNQLLFAPPVFSTDLRGPSGALGPVTGTFDSNSDTEFGNYVITFTGAAAVPEPSTVAFLLAGGIGALAFLRRRRHS